MYKSTETTRNNNNNNNKRKQLMNNEFNSISRIQIDIIFYELVFIKELDGCIEKLKYKELFDFRILIHAQSKLHKFMSMNLQ